MGGWTEGGLGLRVGVGLAAAVGRGRVCRGRGSGSGDAVEDAGVAVWSVGWAFVVPSNIRQGDGVDLGVIGEVGEHAFGPFRHGCVVVFKMVGREFVLGEFRFEAFQWKFRQGDFGGARGSVEEIDEEVLAGGEEGFDEGLVVNEEEG